MDSEYGGLDWATDAPAEYKGMRIYVGSTWDYVARYGLEYPPDRLGVDGDEEDEC